LHATVSTEDGFIRLTLGTLVGIPLVHLMSGLDDESPGDTESEAGPTTVCGYTEWLSTGDHVITIGWDWHLLVTDRSPYCVRVNQPRSNLMLVDANRRDFGLGKTRLLLEAVIDSFSWQDEIIRFISSRYG
jgi:hypothetical protein